jgi:hypothetical protein
MTEPTETTDAEPIPAARRNLLMVIAWLWVGLPFLYGVVELIQKAVQLFGG